MTLDQLQLVQIVLQGGGLAAIIGIWRMSIRIARLLERHDTEITHLKEGQTRIERKVDTHLASRAA